MGGSNFTTQAPDPSTEPEPTMSADEIEKIQFYKTYDVMTGVRIAATLGGFFSLMVLLVIYKSKCKSRSLSDENLEAAVAAAVVEEEKLELAFGKTFSLYGGRRSLGNMSAPVSCHTRFSSVGGGYSIFTPPTRIGYTSRARVSLPTSSPYIYPSPFLTRALNVDNPSKSYREDGEEDDLADVYLAGAQQFLRVPSSRRSSRSSRRLSSITCSSCDTSYLERRGSAMEMGRPIPPPLIGSRRDRLDEEPWDFYYPIDIQVIQPTPEISPCESQNSLYNCPTPKDGLHVPRIAPLASISSCIPSIDQDNRSVGSDSVFLDEELIDTEDEVDEFSTDSDVENIECDIPSIDTKLTKKGSKMFTGYSNDDRVPIRRFSTPTPSLYKGDNLFRHLESVDNSTCPSTSKSTPDRKTSRLTQFKTSSDSDTIHVSAGGDEQTCEKSDKSVFAPRAYMSVSCDHLVKILQEHSSEAEGSKTIVEHCTWSQETLF